MDTISQTFAKHFASWDITLPEENLQSRSSGHVKERGWLIQFCFGRDVDGEYMDYYASHRMTSDRHMRLYESGTKLRLDSLRGMRLTSEDPVEDKRLGEEFVKINHGIAKELVEKGFTLFTMNMTLQAAG